MSKSPSAGSAVIIGASGGIGRALTEAILRQARYASVHALSRRVIALEGAHSHPLDVTDEGTIAAAAARIGEAGPVELVIVATGLLHAEGMAPEKSIRVLDGDVFAHLFAVNTTGPALVAKHFLPLMPRTGRSVFAALSARVGSIDDNRLGGWYGYRASKAALNQILRTVAIEVARTKPDAIVLGLHPGTVATSLSRPFRSEEAAGVFTPAQSAEHLLRVVDGADRKDSGRVFAWDGSVIPS